MNNNDIVTENAPRAYEPPPEIQARHRNFEILTTTALVLLFVILTHGSILVAARWLVRVIYIKELVAFFTIVFIAALGIGLWRGYDYICHSLSYPNIITIVVAEIVMLTGQFIVSHFSAPFLLGYMIIFSAVFILYALIFLKCKFRYRVIISMLTVIVLVTTNYIHLHRMEFTPRYIYMSTAGYQNKISDETIYYYEQPVNQMADGKNPIDKLLEEINIVSEWPLYMAQIEEDESGNYLKYMDVISGEICNLSEVVNFNGKYNDTFFEEYGLCISVLELENPDDTIKCTDFQYSLGFGRPVIEYTKSNSPATDERAICIIIYEVPNTYKESIFFHGPTFNPRKSAIRYS